ncbi:MAG: hypothetical protein NT081_09505 [Actinobacteria bacterium]|nr:hypothetical protein [Actinomycetota bacterium]
MSDTSQGPGWWQASDGKWYPPEQAPGASPQPSVGRLDIGAALSYGWEKFVANLGTMILIVAIFFGVQFVFNIAIQFLKPNGLITGLLVAGVLIAIAVFVGFMIEAGLIRAALAITEGRPPEASMMFSTERLVPFAIGAVIVALLSFVGILVCCIGYVVVRLFLLFWGFYILDPKRNDEPVDAIKNSYNLVSKNAGDVLVFAIVVVVINIVTCGLAIGITEIATGYAYKQLNGDPIAA